jgi:hypothetical protein
MNHHANKIEYSDDVAAIAGFDGVMMEVHTCPGCENLEMQMGRSRAPKSIDPKNFKKFRNREYPGPLRAF